MPKFRTLALAATIIAFATPSLALKWGDFKDNGCIASNVRSYSSVLWDIPWGQSWEDTCLRTGATFKMRNGKNAVFDKPNTCVKAGITDVLDASAFIVGLPGLVYPPAGVAGVVIGATSYGLKFSDAGALNIWGIFHVGDPTCAR
jgi:hypothetical protein